MAEPLDPLAPIEAAGLTIQLEPLLHAASLRCFERDGVFARMAESVTGLSLPNTLKVAQSKSAARGSSAAATHSTDADQAITLLAWRGPSDTTLLTTDEVLLDTLQTAAAEIDDGCIVDQRGGVLVFRARGSEVAQLVAKTAGHGAMPAIGESRRTRLAEVAVLLVKVAAGETLFAVDRIYAPHMMASIRVSAADLDIPLYG
jgi:sarcosine oxidase gamma subunit